MIQNIRKHITTIIVVILLMGITFYMGSLTTEVRLLRQNLNPSRNADLEGPPEPEQLTGPIKPVSEDEHIRGDKNATIALIEYSDFECPFCQSFHITAQEVLNSYAGQVMWVYRHFPLESIHPNARPAAMASECVANLGGNDAFWAYTDILLNGSTTLTEDGLITAASQLGLDITSCLQNEETNHLVDEDLDSGVAAGIQGTPGNVVLNVESGETQFVPGALPLEQLSQAIDSLL